MLLIIFAFCTFAIPERILAYASKELHLKTDGAAVAAAVLPDDFTRIFSEGKAFFDQEKWDRAAEKFKELIDKYPKNKSTDAALYWLAFCYKKQRNHQQASETLDRLLKEFPDSSWVTDASVMRIEVVSSTMPPRNAQTTVIQRRFEDTQREIENLQAKAGYPISQAPPERVDEIRFAAFQSLIYIDKRRAVELAGELLRADSKADETLKQEALRALLRERLSRPSQLTPFMPLLRETLIKGFQQQPNIKIRQEIIYTLAGIYDEPSTRYLTGLYASENSREIKDTIVDSFNNSSRGITGAAALRFGSRVLLIRKIEFEKLLNILQTEKDIDLRRLASDKLRQIGIDQPNLASQVRTAANIIIQLYDAEKDAELKISFIRFLGDTKQNPATRKLLNIAKNDKSAGLRVEAIHSLKKSKEPEVVNFLEQLIK